MADEKPVVVSVVHDTANRFDLETGAVAMPRIVIDRNGFAKDEMSNDHYGARLLCAAALACFTNTFYNTLVNQGGEVKGLSATAEIEKEKDQLSRTRFTVIHMDVVANLDEKYREAFETTKGIMESGSLVTYSLDDAIEMDITMRMNTD